VGLKCFLILLNIIAGIEPILFPNFYHKCLIYQIRFVLFPYKKRFALSYKKEYKERNKKLDTWTIFPSVGIERNGNEALFLIKGITNRGSLDIEKEHEYRFNYFEPLHLMQSLSDLWCGNYKDEYCKVIIVSGVWKVGMPSWWRVKLEKK
jgi:hypothetical protein